MQKLGILLPAIVAIATNISLLSSKARGSDIELSELLLCKLPLVSVTVFPDAVAVPRFKLSMPAMTALLALSILVKGSSGLSSTS